MQVKCPKCRLRFDIQDVAGLREVQCNCPRCGTPFTYAITEENEAKTVKNANEEVRSTEVKTPVSTDKQDDHLQISSNSSSEQQPEEEDKAESNSDFEDKLYDLQEPTVIRDRYLHHSNRHAYIFVVGLIAVVVLVGLIAKGIDSFVGHFTDNDEALSASLAVDSNLMTKDSTNVKKEKGEKKREHGKNGKKQKPEDMPQWLQGRWRTENAKGFIEMNIKGSSIIVTDGKHTNAGTAHCKGNILICKYFDGRTFTYNLDYRKHHIIVGSHMKMSKAAK